MGNREEQNQAFVCSHCGKQVYPLVNGSYRNHCPFCLHSVHLDQNVPGDRSSECRGLMKPMALEMHKKKGYQIVFRCFRCGIQTRNKAAVDDPRQPDDMERIIQLSAKPI